MLPFTAEQRAALYLLALILAAALWLATAAVKSPTTPTNAATPQCTVRGVLPDPLCTPGAIDLSVTQDNIQQTICVSGYTAKVRPPTGYTNNLKITQMQAYGFTETPSAYEEDHLIPLELGGHPTDPHNLWPQYGKIPNKKDAVELFLHHMVCSEGMNLAAAQRMIAKDWTKVRGN